jgi:hypothetical protein
MNPLGTQRELNAGRRFHILEPGDYLNEKKLPVAPEEHLLATGESRKAIQETVESLLPTREYAGEGHA